VLFLAFALDFAMVLRPASPAPPLSALGRKGQTKCHGQTAQERNQGLAS
jgi:hypothetical protein